MWLSTYPAVDPDTLTEAKYEELLALAPVVDMARRGKDVSLALNVRRGNAEVLYHDAFGPPKTDTEDEPDVLGG